jgi:hypothetical protein
VFSDHSQNEPPSSGTRASQSPLKSRCASNFAPGHSLQSLLIHPTHSFPLPGNSDLLLTSSATAWNSPTCWKVGYSCLPHTSIRLHLSKGYPATTWNPPGTGTWKALEHSMALWGLPPPGSDSYPQAGGWGGAHPQSQETRLPQPSPTQGPH